MVYGTHGTHGTRGTRGTRRTRVPYVAAGPHSHRREHRRLRRDALGAGGAAAGRGPLHTSYTLNTLLALHMSRALGALRALHMSRALRAVHVSRALRALHALLQAEDRAHRIGQQCAVNIHYLVAKETVDEAMWRVLQRKVRARAASQRTL